MPAAPSLRLDLRPSRRLIGILAVLHFLALAAASMGLGGWLRFGVWALLLASLGRSLAQALLRTANQPVSLELREDGRASWKNRNGNWREGRLGESHFVSAALAIVGLKDAYGRSTRVVLMPDSVPSEDFRRLRVWLRWHPGATRKEPE
ncbi:MAG TPA: protein YgfX [Burkholderiales bacterium]|nr:protein YgfX [Burkholderiales bacterium]